MKKGINISSVIILACSITLGNFVVAHASEQYPDQIQTLMDVLASISDNIEILNEDDSIQSDTEKLSGIIDAAYDLEYENIKETKKLFKKYYEITIDENSDYLYLGEIKDNKPDGEGMLWKKVEDTDSSYTVYYVGEFEKGEFNGIGWNLEKSALGEFEDNECNGLMLTYSDDMTVFCIGESENGMFDGEINIYSNGALYYEGHMKKDEFDGEGKLYYSNGNLSYDGEFKKGLPHGNGTEYDEDGNIVYSGKWKKGDYTS